VVAGDYANVGEEVQIDWYRLDREQQQRQTEQHAQQQQQPGG
jgi:hypothetical protein